VKRNIIGFEMLLCPHLQMPHGSPEPDWRFVFYSSYRTVCPHLPALTSLCLRLLPSWKGGERKAKGLGDLPTTKHAESSVTSGLTPKPDLSPVVVTPEQTLPWPHDAPRAIVCRPLKEVSRRRIRRQRRWFKQDKKAK